MKALKVVAVLVLIGLAVWPYVKPKSDLKEIKEAIAKTYYEQGYLDCQWGFQMDYQEGVKRFEKSLE